VSGAAAEERSWLRKVLSRYGTRDDAHQQEQCDKTENKD
jgi:hypothetical protein